MIHPSSTTRSSESKAGLHCLKSLQIRSYFWSLFPRIRTEYGEIRSIEVSLRIQSECGKIRTRNNSVWGDFSRSVRASNSNNSFWFWLDKFCSNTTELPSHHVSINFPFFFFRLLHLSNQFLCPLTYLSLAQPWILC